MQFQNFLFKVALFFGLVTILANAAVLEERQSPYVCDVPGSRGTCNTTSARLCITALKSIMTVRSDGRLSWTGNYGAYNGGCRCYAQCRTGANYPTCIVTSAQFDAALYGLRDACISSAAQAKGYTYAYNAKWEFARYP
ncbi:hypothetical protein ONZ45_g17153 [Pleurotus djamor]|nr:hypothetical protein ONZ45_g17153 [Pleurotus djamor]